MEFEPNKVAKLCEDKLYQNLYTIAQHRRAALHIVFRVEDGICKN